MSLEAPTRVGGRGARAVARSRRRSRTPSAASPSSTSRRFSTPALLEAAAAIAFQEAAAENFPPQLIVPELHESSVGGSWVAMPLGKGRKYYKKFTRVFDVEITPQMAASLRTFGGTTLAAFLKDQLGVDRTGAGARPPLPGDARERRPRGSRGSSGACKGSARASRSTGQAAPSAVTARPPGCCCSSRSSGDATPGAFRTNRRRTAVGQRFYYLEVAGARPRLPRPAGRQRASSRSSEVNLTLDFPKDEFRVVRLPERGRRAGASRRKLRKPRRHGGARRAPGSSTRPASRPRSAATSSRHVKIVSEALPQEQFTGLAGQLTGMVKARLAKKLVEWIGKGVADYLAAARRRARRGDRGSRPTARPSS